MQNNFSANLICNHVFGLYSYLEVIVDWKQVIFPTADRLKASFMPF